LTPAQVKALRLLINRSASWASWDEELLALELAELNALGFDLAFTGFDAREIDDLLFRSTESSDNFAPAPAEASAVVTTRGDIWRCGEHRVVCGNATSQEDVKRLQAGVPPGIMITDPPYGISFDPAWRERAGLGAVRQVGKVANDDCAAGS
jgi:hypothetical protein